MEEHKDKESELKNLNKTMKQGSSAVNNFTRGLEFNLENEEEAKQPPEEEKIRNKAEETEKRKTGLEPMG